MSAGLWEKDVRLSHYVDIEYNVIYRLADEQTVVGLVAAGLEHVVDVKVPQEIALSFAGYALQIEQRNNAMNGFVSNLINKLREKDIYALLVKGQGVAQCYERPLWRASGDVDLYLSRSNYEKAKVALRSYSRHIEEDINRLHCSITIKSWLVELHGKMHTEMSRRVNKVLDEMHKDLFYSENVRSWHNGSVCIFLPSADNDVILVFTHFLGHFYGGGIGLRQVCDWARLLYTYKDIIDRKKLYVRLKKMGLMTEWLSFESFANDYLGMPDVLLLTDKNKDRYRKKAHQINQLILDSGNMGHNKDESYRERHTGLVLNIITLWRRLCEYAKILLLFPKNTPKFFLYYCYSRIKSIA